MRHFSLSISKILVRAEGGHFEHVVYRWCSLLHIWRFLDNYCQSCLWLFSDSLKCLCTCTALTAQSLQISLGSASTYFRWCGHYICRLLLKFIPEHAHQFFYWIRFIFDQRTAKINWHVFFWDMVYNRKIKFLSKLKCTDNRVCKLFERNICDELCELCQVSVHNLT